MRTKQYFAYKYESLTYKLGGGNFVQLRKNHKETLNKKKTHLYPTSHPAHFSIFSILKLSHCLYQPWFFFSRTSCKAPLSCAETRENLLSLFPWHSLGLENQLDLPPCPPLNSSVSALTQPRQSLHLHLPHQTSSPPLAARHRHPTKTFPLHTTDLPAFSLR